MYLFLKGANKVVFVDKHIRRIAVINIQIYKHTTKYIPLAGLILIAIQLWDEAWLST